MGLLGSDRLDRRGFLKRFGIAGAVGGAGIVGRRELLAASNHSGGDAHDHHGAMAPGGHAQHGGGGRLRGHGLGAVGRVDHARNGFDPMKILTDFDPGEVSRDSSGRTVREYEFVAVDKEIEIAPGVFFPAWTYNGRVPGPTIRATEGLAIVAPLGSSEERPALWHFAALGALAGLPAVLGAWGGGFAFSPAPAALAFGVAAGAIAQVIWQIGRGMSRSDERSRGFGAAGLVIGFLVMYVTGLLT